MVEEKKVKAVKKTPAVKSDSTPVKEKKVTSQVKVKSQSVPKVSNKSNAPIQTGKKKTAIASVIINRKSGANALFLVNSRALTEYFSIARLVKISTSPFEIANMDISEYDICVKMSGGGLASQAYALRHAISKYIASIGEESRAVIKKAGLLTRDARIVERKKYGLRKARKKEQFSKR